MGGGNKRVYTFLNNTSPIMSVIARLEFKLVYYDVEVQYVISFATFPLLEREEWGRKIYLEVFSFFLFFLFFFFYQPFQSRQIIQF